MMRVDGVAEQLEPQNRVVNKGLIPAARKWLISKGTFPEFSLASNNPPTVRKEIVAGHPYRAGVNSLNVAAGSLLVFNVCCLNRCRRLSSFAS
jgi:hypothetical protein